jgi:hypothetical protein
MTESAGPRALGSLVLDGHIMPIAHIYLFDGKIRFRTVMIHGPLELPAAGDVRVHDATGKVVATVPLRMPEPLVWTAEDSGEFDLPLTVHSVNRGTPGNPLWRPGNG